MTTRRVAIAFLAASALMQVSAADAQGVSPPAASQNPSPMVDQTRAHERLTQKELGGVTRSFAGPAGKLVELFIPDQARGRDVVDLVVHFLGAAWLPEQAVAGLQQNTIVAVVNLGAGSSSDFTGADSLNYRCFRNPPENGPRPRTAGANPWPARGRRADRS